MKDELEDRIILEATLGGHLPHVQQESDSFRKYSIRRQWKLLLIKKIFVRTVTTKWKFIFKILEDKIARMAWTWKLVLTLTLPYSLENIS